MQRKFLAMLLTLCMVITLIPTVAFAAENVEMKTDVSTVKVGQDVVVSVIIPASTGEKAYSAGVKFTFDKDVFEVKNFSAPSFNGTTPSGQNAGSGFISCTYMGDLGGNTIECNQPVEISATFTVKEGATAGAYDFVLDADFTHLKKVEEDGYTETDLISIPAGTKATVNVVSELTSEQAVTGIVAPSKGASPNTTTGTAPANTSIGKIEWFNGASALTGSDKFQGGETYTVKVTLKPDTGYAFASGVTGKINGNDASVSADGSNIVLSYTFSALPEKTVSSIKITTPPTKTEYIEGQSFDVTGMVVEATYDDETKGNVTEFTYTPDGALSTTNTSITVSFGGQTANQAITVVAKKITSIDITAEPTKKVYEIGDTPDWTGMEVTASYNDGSSRVLESSEYSVTGFNSSAYAESQTITVTSTAGSKTDTFTVKIDKKAIAAADAFNYVAPANLVYNKTDKEPTVTNKTPYDGSATVTYEKGGEAVTATKTVGTYKVFVSADATSTYKAIEKTEIGQFTVIPKELSMTASVTAKNFDGNRTATITKGSLTGVESGDAVSIAEDSITGTFNNEFAGTGKTVTTVNLFTLSGADKDNYTLKQPTSLTGNINAATQTITANESKLKVVKNGSLTADTLKANISGAIGDLTFTVKSGTAGTITSNAFYAGDTTGSVTVAVKAAAKDLNADTTNEYSESSEITFEIEVVSKYDAGVTIQQLPDEKKVTYGDTFTLKAVASKTEADGTWKWTVDTSVFEIVGADNADTLTVKAKAANASAKDITAKYESSQYLGEKTEAITVEVKVIAVPSADTTIFTYNGEDQTYTLAENSAYEIQKNVQKDADTYTVKAVLKDKVNTKWSDSTTNDKEYNFIINKADITVKAVDRKIFVNDEVPTLTASVLGTDYTVTGLFGSDAVSGVAMEYQKDSTTATPDNTKAGNYDIVITAATAGDNYNVTKVNGTLTISAKSSGGYIPTVEKPTIEAGEGVKVTLSADGTKATITVEEGYVLTDVVLNGVSKGKVTEVKGLKTGDKLVVTVEKQKTVPTKAEIQAQLKEQILAARSRVVTMKNGKKAVKITWINENGELMDFDGVEIFRSTKRYSGYGKTPIYDTEKQAYYNTAVKAGTKYYYKVRGYVEFEGEKIYTEWSKKAIRTVK